MPIRVFLHAEFIYAMKTLQNPTIFMKKCKKKKMEKLIILVISVNFLRFSLKLLRRISEKVRKYVFLDGKEDKKSKIRNFQIFEKISFIARIAYDKIGGNYALSANSTKICLLGYFCMQNSYLR